MGSIQTWRAGDDANPNVAQAEHIANQACGHQAVFCQGHLNFPGRSSP
jgi:hypothetical protein